jgi:hypothetical protein
LSHEIRLEYLSEIVSLHEATNLGAVRGCSVEAVEGMRQVFSGKLPRAYAEFLFWAGHHGGELLRGSSCFMHDLPDIQSAADALLRANGFRHRLPSDAVVIWMHQGYQFLFLRLGEGDDPPLHYYNEYDGMRDFAWRRYPTFTEFLAREVAGHAQMAQEIAGVPNGIDQFVAVSVPVHPRDGDAEAKLVAQIAQHYGGTEGQVYPDVQGTVPLVTQKPVCIACRWAVWQLQCMYPNMVIEVREVG